MSNLDGIRIAKPCPMAWSDMAGNDKERFCCKCDQRVYNLTEMTTAEAEALLSSRDSRLCVRYFRRADGRIMTRDCPVGVRRAGTQRKVMAAGILAFLFNHVTAVVPDRFAGRWSTGETALPITESNISSELERRLKPLRRAATGAEVMGSPQPAPLTDHRYEMGDAAIPSPSLATSIRRKP